MEIYVLVATKNGALYLSEQLDSIKRQTIPVKILASDDGSTDRTIDILEEYNVSTTIGPCKGPAMNFFSLIQNAPVGDYFALSDQDDIWDSDKIEIGIRSLQNIRGPALYIGSVRTQTGQILVPRDNQYPQYILSNNAMGCTMILNRELLEMVRNQHTSWADAIMHDWWIHLFASAVGSIVYDKTPHMTYRLHSMNHTGIPSWFSRIKRFLFAVIHPGSKRKTIFQYESIQKISASNLSQSDSLEKMVEKISSPWTTRLVFVCRHRFSHKSFDNVILKIMILFGVYA